MVDVPRSKQSFSTLSGWVALHKRRMAHGRSSTPANALLFRIFVALRPWMLEKSHDLDGLREVLEYLKTGRFDYGAPPTGWRGHHVALRMAAHNRIHQLETGSAFRDRVRHGPADPSRMPENALDCVIQACRDMELVERCRAEKARRMKTAA